MPSRVSLKHLVWSILFSAVALATTECDAQRQRRFFKRQFHLQPPALVDQQKEAQANVATDNTPDEVKATPTAVEHVDHVTGPHRQRLWFAPTQNIYGPHSYNSSRYDPRSPMYDPSTPYPKYIGGFHASEIHNLGIPSGHRGFRGNGLYWAPWQ